MTTRIRSTNPMITEAFGAFTIGFIIVAATLWGNYTLSSILTFGFALYLGYQFLTRRHRPTYWTRHVGTGLSRLLACTLSPLTAFLIERFRPETEIMPTFAAAIVVFAVTDNIHDIKREMRRHMTRRA